MPRTISDKEPFFCFNGFLSVTQEDTGMILATQPLHPALSELNSRALSELVWQYCFGDDCEAELIKAYHLNCEPGKLLKILPLIQAEWVCPYCQQHMVRKILPKSAKLGIGEPFCPSCKHLKSLQCPCTGCKKGQVIQQQARPGK